MNKKPVSFNRAVMFMGLAFVTGLTGPAFAKQPDDVPILEVILDRLETLQNTVDNLSTEVDLRGVTQNWDKKLDATNGDANGCNSDRFTCLFGDTVVRDNETGLVWDRSPSTSRRGWHDASNECAGHEAGGRQGWSLPTREQLKSLVDKTGTSGVTLPDGHPFQNVEAADYWTATTRERDPLEAWGVMFDSNNFPGFMSPIFKGDPANAWCARGGQSFDGNPHQTWH